MQQRWAGRRLAVGTLIAANWNEATSTVPVGGFKLELISCITDGKIHPTNQSAKIRSQRQAAPRALSLLYRLSTSTVVKCLQLAWQPAQCCSGCAKTSIWEMLKG